MDDTEEETSGHCEGCESVRIEALRAAIDTVGIASQFEHGLIPPEPCIIGEIAQGYECYIRTGELPEAWMSATEATMEHKLNSVSFEGAEEV